MVFISRLSLHKLDLQLLRQRSLDLGLVRAFDLNSLIVTVKLYQSTACSFLSVKRKSPSFFSGMSTSSSNFSAFSDLKVLKNTDVFVTDTRMDKFLIVGLGNDISPDTRHSVGMMAVEKLLNLLGSHWEKQRKIIKDHGGHLAQALIATDDPCMSPTQLFILKPESLMNISGKSVLKAAKELDIGADKIYLVHDEMEKAVGKFNLKTGGSARGHKGVLSCTECLRSSTLWPRADGDFKGLTRLRIGIGRPADKSEVVRYVLGHFQDEEVDKINMAIYGGLNVLLKDIANRLSTQGLGEGGDDT